MIYDIRGGLGNQVLELLAARADAIERGDRVEGIRINVKASDLAHVKTDWLSALFRLDCPVEKVIGGAKMACWEKLPLILRHREAAIEGLLALPPAPVPGALVHVRYGDRAPVKAETYASAILRHVPGDCTIVGDNPEVCEQLARDVCAAYQPADPVADWRRTVGAASVIGSISSFTLSALMFAPAKRLRWIGAQDGPRPIPPREADGMAAVMRAMPDFAWI